MKKKCISMLISVILLSTSMLLGCQNVTQQKSEAESYATQQEIETDIATENNTGSITDTENLEEELNNRPSWDITTEELLSNLQKDNTGLSVAKSKDDQYLMIVSSDNGYYTVELSDKEDNGEITGGVEFVYFTINDKHPTENDKLYKDLNISLKSVLTSLGENYDEKEIKAFFEKFENDTSEEPYEEMECSDNTVLGLQNDDKGVFLTITANYDN